MSYTEKIIDVECENGRVPVCVLCATCGVCAHAARGYTMNPPLEGDTACYCHKHGKEFDYFSEPCDDFC